uniref:U2 small nuclear ribonucleoprotein auxiliary factor-like protein n=1 Tax=Arabidopsis thaliana TaxID=3702 RepID=UPI0025811FFB|nr:Chain A, U2 small nuclear ribonucleoprotein auxiliary factor-like protein [Arabidopsis thaliana]8P26_B Chain B, U2 small nuclear ribonucleoprotein auxiliary factor-like protein [Arabidopsis thaliana]8P26_C Chain C, U2 small nuclear ribonucleoprotein auxiliary factor-like protein [Arabidopsis thaliana]8P26_D Chain D, U2 small nuclear ribonucleoprotein auxiliary factor-like protein [Arabidopsis thaliana]8P26_E Chain E, U2 small nuclear ribonucleoprotein auxiliary factor-like protein [Arabidops
GSMASFEKFEPIFGEVVPERSDPGSGLLRRCLFHVYASDSYNLTVHVTDFISGVWTTILSVSQLDDMRDTVGIGGSWSEFVDYTVASLKSDNVKLLLGETSVSNGVKTARLVSQKAKGMPRINVPLTKMVESSASEAMANLSLELFRAFKSKQHLQGEVSFSAAATDEKDKRDATYNQLERYSRKLDVMAPSTNNRQDSPANQSAREANTKNPVKRVPAHRRTRKRGALLQDSEEEDG